MPSEPPSHPTAVAARQVPGVLSCRRRAAAARLGPGEPPSYPTAAAARPVPVVQQCRLPMEAAFPGPDMPPSCPVVAAARLVPTEQPTRPTAAAALPAPTGPPRHQLAEAARPALVVPPCAQPHQERQWSSWPRGGTRSAEGGRKAAGDEGSGGGNVGPPGAARKLNSRRWVRSVACSGSEKGGSDGERSVASSAAHMPRLARNGI